MIGDVAATINTVLQPLRRPMNKGLIWTIVGILLIVALIIWIAGRV